MQRSTPVGPPADWVTDKVSSIYKDPAMIVHQEHPLNVGAPPECVRQTFLTPKERFFVRNHGAVPEVDVQRYRLSLTGLVQLPLDLSLDLAVLGGDAESSSWHLSDCGVCLGLSWTYPTKRCQADLEL